MTNYRPQRVAEEIKKQVASIIENDLKDPRIGFATVTDVEVSNDLRHTKIFVSIYGSEEEKQKTLEALQNAVGFVRKEIGNRIKLRHTPEIQFKFDNSLEHSEKIAKLLEQVKEEES